VPSKLFTLTLTYLLTLTICSYYLLLLFNLLQYQNYILLLSRTYLLLLFTLTIYSYYYEFFQYPNDQSKVLMSCAIKQRRHSQPHTYSHYLLTPISKQFSLTLTYLLTLTIYCHYYEFSPISKLYTLTLTYLLTPTIYSYYYEFPSISKQQRQSRHHTNASYLLLLFT
jgi:hypothetical protein